MWLKFLQGKTSITIHQTITDYNVDTYGIFGGRDLRFLKDLTYSFCVFGRIPTYEQMFNI